MNEYFQIRRNIKNPIFFDRFSEIQYEGLKILDLGCGHGALSIDLALKGAKEIVGIDLNSELISFANRNLKSNFPELTKKYLLRLLI